MPRQTHTAEYILGLDIGAESIGWAILASRDCEPIGIIRLGTHTFDAAVEGDYESGRDESKAAPRRAARASRRQHWRRTRRRGKLLRILQSAGLMPAGRIDSPAEVHELVYRLDQELRLKHIAAGDHAQAQLLPYLLRARALDGPLTPHELGRALYHLAQRRGFLSNRKARKKDEDAGVVKKGIAELDHRMAEANARTLGEYFAGLDTREVRIRSRWTGRPMYEAEFNKILDSQKPFHPCLSDDMRAKIRQAIFFQRPLKNQSHLIGECELIAGHRRAPMALRVAQRFRILQAANHLQVESPDGSSRRLTPEERCDLVNELAVKPKLSFKGIRKLLKLPANAGFNLQRGGEKELKGHTTDAALLEVFGKKWTAFSELQRDTIVDEILSFEKEEALARRAETAWGLDRESADALAETTFEPGYAAHCRLALTRLVALMEQGSPYQTARQEAFPERFAPAEAYASLPPVQNAVRNLRNPAVCRALTELRKLVNAIIRRYGKPAAIRVELARDLKRSRKQREELSKQMRDRQKLREVAKARILKDQGISSPSRADVEKVLLAEECGWRCPYTNRSICMETLLGQNPQFDVEHIIPFSRGFDDSFANKTLCFHEENRNRKRNHTPFEAYGNTPAWDEMLLRIQQFKGPFGRTKLTRFRMEELPEGFTTRQLNDTRYMSRAAGNYLAMLYGGRWDDDHRQRIQTSAGAVTAYLRDELGLNGILDDGGTKTRQDHRHHAVDALCIAISSLGMVKRLQDAAKDPWSHRRRRFAPLGDPWPSFLDSVRPAVDAIKVSRRPNRKLSGPLHAESFYSKPQVVRTRNSKPLEHRHIRKELKKLSRTEIAGDAIVDPHVRALVQAKFAQLGGGDPKVKFGDPASHPVMKTHDGRFVPIHKVRLRVAEKPWQVGGRGRERFVTAKPGSNHHTVIVATILADGTETAWEDHVVSRYEVHQRRQCEESVVQRDWGPGRNMRFSLMPGDYVVMAYDQRPEALYRVKSISSGDIEFILHSDARMADDRKKERVRARTADTLRRWHARKVHVSYLGEILPAND